MGPEPTFMERARALEGAYLESDDPERQSGFSGGRERWVAERSPLVQGIDRDGELLDVGCANGLLAADIVEWAAGAGFAIAPHGVDLGPGLIEIARNRLPGFSSNFHVADAWTWSPHRQWTFVYSVLDLAPEALRCEWLQRLHRWVEPGGTLIIGSYGSRTRSIEPIDVASVLGSCGFLVAGSSHGGESRLTRFGWTVKGK